MFTGLEPPQGSPLATRVVPFAARRAAPSRPLSIGGGRRVPDRDVVFVGRPRVDRPGRDRRKRWVAVAVGALVGAAIHYGAWAAREWTVITVSPPEHGRTMIT